MSDSNEKKKERRANERQREEQSRKSLRTKTIIVAVVIVLMAAFVIVFSSNLFYSGVNAVTIDGEGYTAADFNYYYFAAYNQRYSQYYDYYESYGDYASMFISMPDLSTSLKDQYYDEDTTWAEYFQEQAFEQMKSVTMLCREAEANDFTLTQDQLDEIDTAIESLRTEVTESEDYESLSAYLRYYYGKGMTEKKYRENVERTTLANNYAEYKEDSFQYDNDTINAYYDEHADEYDYITYYAYFVSAGVTEDDEETEEDETVTFEDGMAAAKETADSILAAGTSEEAFAEAAAEVAGYDISSQSTQGSSLSSYYSEWLLDPDRTAGDTEAISVGSEDNTSGAGYYVMYFVNRDNNRYQAVSCYYILSTPETVDSTEYETDEEYEEAVESASDASYQTLSLLLDGFEGSDKTYDTFTSLYTDNTSMLSEGGDLDGIGMYGMPDAITNWLYDDARQEGDVGMVYDEDYGWFLLYFKSHDGIYGELLAENTMRAEDYDSWSEEMLEGYSVSTGWVMGFATKKMLALGG